MREKLIMLRNDCNGLINERYDEINDNQNRCFLSFKFLEKTILLRNITNKTFHASPESIYAQYRHTPKNLTNNYLHLNSFRKYSYRRSDTI